jgi:hypothetical protein
MPNESELKAEIGHVLLIDIVGYSKLLINQQGELLQTLKQMVQETAPGLREQNNLDSTADSREQSGESLQSRD